MNSNRTKYDEILSTSWHLLTMKNWKSDQELKRKMGLLNKTTSNFGSGSSSSNGIGGIGIGKAGIGGGGGVNGSGGFWFREKTTNIKPFFTGRRRIDNHQSQQSIHQHKQQSKGIKISTIVNHCPLINQYLPSNKSLHCQYESIPLEESEIFSLPEAKSKFSLDNTSSYNTNNKKNKYTKPITSQSHINTPDEVNKKTKPKIQTKNMNNHNITSKLTHSNEFDTFNKNENTSTISMITNDSNHHIQQNHSSLTINPITMITNHKDHSLPAPPPPSSSSSSSSVGTATTLSTTATTATITTTTTTTQHHTNNKPHHSDYENVTNQTDKLCNNYSIKKFHEKSIIIETSKINNSNENTKKLSDDIDNILLKSNEKMNIPMTPRTALDMYSKKLTTFEREEILSFSKIWYLGLSAQKIDGIQGSSNNHGYDDDNGGYLKITHDHIAYRFQTLETLGKGSFGRVIRAIDHKSGFPVAIKIIRNKKRFHQQAQVEVAILENLKKADHKNTHNIIHIRDHFTFRNHLCIVFDLLGSNLYDLLRKNDFRGFTIHSLKKITVKLLNCLCLLRKQGIIHCDLKPENILIGLNNSSELKVIDFGSSCFTNQKTYTYIQSRFYRAPEIILGISYGPPIDMWSLGCILPELYTGRPLFPGENENEQLACIMEVLGVPSELLLEKASRRRVFFDSKRTPRYLTNSRGRKRIPGSETIENLVKTVDSKFINLLNQCLTWDPDERLTPNEALNHEWILHENEHNKQNITFQTIEHTNSENKQKDTIA
ncbi:Dual specificity tyrosine-phosphorylation-regulated kinase 4 [Schistosoma japonicum]|uniref:dual-specificity kinase n=2 Tax=Schistosoma japonicum TaxID=6182 RepID=A0A4Z2CUC2_SCHJA|nr:Dual specificity tyrosine-phosphorylation-regulated kinase 4 [Schistosoma japonicum]